MDSVKKPNISKTFRQVKCLFIQKVFCVIASSAELVTTHPPELLGRYIGNVSENMGDLCLLNSNMASFGMHPLAFPLPSGGSTPQTNATSPNFARPPSAVPPQQGVMFGAGGDDMSLFEQQQTYRLNFGHLLEYSAQKLSFSEFMRVKIAAANIVHYLMSFYSSVALSHLAIVDSMIASTVMVRPFFAI